ncbi:MAG: CNNM domain-containing protein, partial [Candidatus Binatota bacterium]
MFIEGFWFEVVLIFFLILANGFFAAAEIAVIATRKTRIDSLVEKGIRSASVVARLKDDPDRFLATVQIGVTLVGTLASAIGGAAAIQFLKPLIESLPLPLVSRWGESIAILLVVLPIAYLSLVFGELVP